MKIDLKRLLKRVPSCLMALVYVVFIGGLSIANGRIEVPKIDHSSNIDRRDGNIAKILSVLENKCEDPNVTEKVKDKLLTMSDKKTRLIVSLADLIANDSQIPGTEIVFFVITILITVS